MRVFLPITQLQAPRAHRPAVVNVLRRVLLAAIIAAIVAPGAGAQIPFPDDRVPAPGHRIKLAGPRVGLTYLGGAIVDSLKANEIDVSAVITQFGWQWERQFFATGTGPAGVSEWVLLVGGLEQGVFLPSLSWLVGMRTMGGTEFGVGPNLGVSGASLAFVGGFTNRLGGMNIPVNVAVVPSKIGWRFSVLTGFTTRD